MEALRRYVTIYENTLAGVSYRQTVYPASANQGRATLRKRDLYRYKFWAPYADQLYRTDAEKDIYYAHGRRVVGVGLLMADHTDTQETLWSTVHENRAFDTVDSQWKTNKSIWPLAARTDLLTSDPYPFTGDRGAKNFELLKTIGSGPYSKHFSYQLNPTVTSAYRSDGAGNLLNNYSMFHRNIVGGAATVQAQPVPELRFTPSYSRVHTLVARDSAHSPCAPEAIQARKYLYPDTSAGT